MFKILFYFGGGIKVKINNFKFGIFMYENILRLFFSFINLYKKKGIEKKFKMCLYVNVLMYIINLFKKD